jgi:hypothetical protein
VSRAAEPLAERHLDVQPALVVAVLERGTVHGAVLPLVGAHRHDGARPVRSRSRPRRGRRTGRGRPGQPEIAEELMLSRHTVLTHVARVLAKLQVQSRVEVARAAADRLAPAGR